MQTWGRFQAHRIPVLVAVLVATFAAVLFIPTLSDYFGLTARPGRLHHH